MSEAAGGADGGGRVFFTSTGRSLETEDEIRLTSVGVDIGSSTSHLAFSRITLERLDNRYIVADREILHESEVILTPYARDGSIDQQLLGRFVERQYELAGLSPQQIDSGALILTGVAVRRRNARAIGDLFSQEAGKFVAVSAGDALECTLAAFGSGAVARSIRDGRRVMNVDIGGGTSKIAVCEDGELTELTAVDIGARIVSFDSDWRVLRIEEAAKRFAAEVQLDLAAGSRADPEGVDRMVNRMAERLFEVMSSGSVSAQSASLLRLPALANARPPDEITFSGGVSEFIYGRQHGAFGDLGPALARAIQKAMGNWQSRVRVPEQGIRATVIGASQYTVQLSGSTIFVDPLDSLPMRNVPALLPDLPLMHEALNPGAIAEAIRAALFRQDLQDSDAPVGLCYRWQGSATYARLEAFSRGVIQGLGPLLSRGLPLVLVGDSDIGGLIGIHFHESKEFKNPIVSVDGVSLNAFDFFDIGEILDSSGAVPVVIKSLVFPGTSAIGQPGAR